LWAMTLCVFVCLVVGATWPCQWLAHLRAFIAGNVCSRTTP
jgi:hypothetical protein